MKNLVILIGNLGSKPEVKFMKNGKAFVNVSLATNKSWKDKETGERIKKTEWHNLTFFDKLAEIVGKYPDKGSLIYVEGELKTDKYDKNGVDTYSTKIIVNEMKMLDGKQSEPVAPSDVPDEDIPF